MGSKLTLEEFSKRYDELFVEACELFEKYNPCEIHDESCARHRDSKAKWSSPFCCDGCRHLSDDGCTVDALWCKLWYCHYQNLSKSFERKRQALIDRAADMNMLAFRRSKEEMMEEIYGTMDGSVQLQRTG